MNKNNYVVIMAGGGGTRLWPYSRNNYPKQFHDLLGTGRTFLQATVDRFSGICPIENVYIVSNEIYYDFIKEQLPALSDQQILLEPIKRNTAPCIAYACYKIAKQNPDANIVVAPADQMIEPVEQFQETILKALAYTAEKGILVTLGIKPTRPDTGYGYIQFDDESNKDIKKVKTFVEKPDLETAKNYIATGEFVWNAGIFIWNVQAILKSFALYMPDITEIFEDIKTALFTEEESKAIKTAYSLCRSESIDNGIMEKAYQIGNVFVILADFEWSDLGTWKSLYEKSSKDENKNVATGNLMLYDTKNSIIKMSQDKLVVIQGLDNYIVAEFDDVLLICRKEDEQRVKDFVADAKNKGNKFI